MNVYRVDIEGKGGVEIYVITAEEPTLAVESGVRRYELEHGKGTALRCQIYTLDGELIATQIVEGAA